MPLATPGCQPRSGFFTLAHGQGCGWRDCSGGDRPVLADYNRAMLTHDEASTLFKQLVAVNAEMDQYAAKTRDINERLTTAKSSKTKLRQKELADMMAELLKNQQDFRNCSLRGVGLYVRLRDAGFGTPQLDEWARKVSEQGNPPPRQT